MDFSSSSTLILLIVIVFMLGGIMNALELQNAALASLQEEVTKVKALLANTPTEEAIQANTDKINAIVEDLKTITGG